MQNMMSMMNMMGGGMGGMGCGGMGGMGCGGMGGVPGMGMGAAGGANGMEILQQVLQMIPDRVAQDMRGFSLRCAIHDSHANALQGTGGVHKMEVEQITGTSVQVSTQASNSGHRALSVTGPLFGAVAAYIRLMKRYMDVEASTRR